MYKNHKNLPKYPSIQAIDFVLSIWEYNKLGETFKIAIGGSVASKVNLVVNLKARTIKFLIHT